MNSKILWIRLALGILCWAGAYWVSEWMWQAVYAYKLWQNEPLYLLCLVWLGAACVASTLPNRKALMGAGIAGAIVFGLTILMLQTKDETPIAAASVAGILATFLMWGLLKQPKFMFPQHHQLVLASSASGVLLAAGFMIVPTFWTIFVALVPLLWVEHVVSKNSDTPSKWTIFKFAFNTFYIWNILTTFWVVNTGFIPGLIATTANAALQAIPFVLFHIIKKRHNVKVGNVAFVSWWMTFEWWHMYWDLSWPWLTIGNSFAATPQLVQWYQWTGVFGGAFWILVVNVLISNRFNEWYDKASAENNFKINVPILKTIFLKPLIFIVVPIAISLIQYYTYVEPQGKKVEVAVVQPNYEPHFVKFNVPQSKQLGHFTQLSLQAITENTDYLVFPETSFDEIEYDKLPQEMIIVFLRDMLSKFPKLNLVTGISSYIIYKDKAKATPTAQTVCRGENCITYDGFNAAIQLNTSPEIPFYIKSKLVPGAEIIPYIGRYEFFQNWILSLGGAMGVGLATQEKRMVFKSPAGAVAPIICYESVYGDYVTDYVKLGAQALFVVTNDGWWGNTPGHIQHLNMSRLRAIENRRWVVRSANSGVSAYINPRGDIMLASKYDEATFLRSNITLHSERTFYSTWGDLIGRVSILLSILLVVSSIAKMITPKE